MNGLEASVVDNSELWIQALDPADPRRMLIKVAGPAALAVNKLFKLGERLATPRRLEPKDAHDFYRLLRATETEEVVAGFAALLADGRSNLVALQAIEYLDQLFGDPSSLGSQMAGQAEEGLGDLEIAVASVAALPQTSRRESPPLRTPSPVDLQSRRPASQRTHRRDSRPGGLWRARPRR